MMESFVLARGLEGWAIISVDNDKTILRHGSARLTPGSQDTVYMDNQAGFNKSSSTKLFEQQCGSETKVNKQEILIIHCS